MLASTRRDPWRAAYDAALAACEDLGEFSPYWVYPGAAKIERHVLPSPLSRDLTRYQQLKVDLATYRLAFGQPRQEDLLELMKRRGMTPQPSPWIYGPRAYDPATQLTTSIRRGSWMTDKHYEPKTTIRSTDGGWKRSNP